MIRFFVYAIRLFFISIRKVIMKTLYFSAIFQKPGTAKSWAYSTYKSFKVNSIFGKTDGMVSLMSASQLDTSSGTDKAEKLHTSWMPREFTDADAKSWVVDHPREAILAFHPDDESYDVITIEEHQHILKNKFSWEEFQNSKVQEQVQPTAQV